MQILTPQRSTMGQTLELEQLDVRSGLLYAVPPSLKMFVIWKSLNSFTEQRYIPLS